MRTSTDEPADTTMMRIVHDALRRDLARAASVLGGKRSTADQRRAVGAHVGWMMAFLHAHHASEDQGLYPLARERLAGDAAALAVLDRMGRDHERITDAVTEVERAAAELALDGGAATADVVVKALEGLDAVLLPHLRTEEDDAMPVVAGAVTASEWLAIEKEHNLDPKSMPELAFEGHWLIDDATDADRATVLGLVPRVPRFVMVRGFGRRYRRHARRCWAPAPPRRVQMTAEVGVTVAADIDAVWHIVSDVRRVGEWSHECVGAEWLSGADEAVPGARFRGRNRSGMLRWGRVCEIISADPYELVWRTVPTALYPDSSEWWISLAETDDGTSITQGFRVVRAPKILAVAFAFLIPGHRDRTVALTQDLERLGRVAAGSRTVLTPRQFTPS